MSDRDTLLHLPQIVIGLLQWLHINMKVSISIVTQKGDFNVRAGIQDIIILDVFNMGAIA